MSASDVLLQNNPCETARSEIRVAVPSKGALAEGATDLLCEAGYRSRRDVKSLRSFDRANGIEFFFLRPRDIATYVGEGIIDLGVTGRDLLVDSGAKVVEVLPLEFGRSEFCFAVPQGVVLDLTASPPLRIATSYTRLLHDYLQKVGSNACVVPLDGSVEIAPALGVADVVADVVDSGRTLREAGLVLAGDVILSSEAVLISRKPTEESSPAVRVLIERLRGVVVASQYAMVDYDIPESLVGDATKLTPGIESPTISPLRRDGWVAIRSLVPRRDINNVIDKLRDIGAKGVLVSDIRTCRI